MTEERGRRAREPVVVVPALLLWPSCCGGEGARANQDVRSSPAAPSGRSGYTIGRRAVLLAGAAPAGRGRLAALTASLTSTVCRFSSELSHTRSLREPPYLASKSAVDHAYMLTLATAEAITSFISVCSSEFEKYGATAQRTYRVTFCGACMNSSILECSSVSTHARPSPRVTRCA